MPVQLDNKSSDTESYFKRGARIKEPLRQRMIEEAVRYAPAPVDQQALALARANLHKSWARRWLKARGLHV